jgi:hypothetical protein
VTVHLFLEERTVCKAGEGIPERTFSKLLHGGLNSFFQVVHGKGDGAELLRKLFDGCGRILGVVALAHSSHSCEERGQGAGDARKEKQKEENSQSSEERNGQDAESDHATHGALVFSKGHLRAEDQVPSLEKGKEPIIVFSLSVLCLEENTFSFRQKWAGQRDLREICSEDSIAFPRAQKELSRSVIEGKSSCFREAHAFFDEAGQIFQEDRPHDQAVELFLSEDRNGEENEHLVAYSSEERRRDEFFSPFGSLEIRTVLKIWRIFGSNTESGVHEKHSVLTDICDAVQIFLALDETKKISVHRLQVPFFDGVNPGDSPDFLEVVAIPVGKKGALEIQNILKTFGEREMYVMSFGEEERQRRKKNNGNEEQKEREKHAPEAFGWKGHRNDRPFFIKRKTTSS